MKWINFLHIYQLSNTDGYAIKEATERSYKRIIKALEENPNIKFTLNITGCLILRWRELGYSDVVARINKLIKSGQIELTGSVSYHCLMPLTPAEEVKKQIKENTKILKQNFGKDLKLKGFFMPEMAYGKEAAKIVKSLGFSWIILDEFAFSVKEGQVDFEKIYQDNNSGLKVIFRSREFSSCYLPNIINKDSDSLKNKLIITATDGELYGLRHNDPLGEFEKILKRKDIRTETISNFISRKKIEKIKLAPCNWESSKKELKDNKPYFSWFNKNNEIQRRMWRFANHIHAIILKFEKDDNYEWARLHLSRSFASCAFWWASAKDFSHVYGPYAWNPDEIERGINEMVRAVRSLHDIASRKIKIKIEKEYTEIKRMIWEKHWTYYWRKGEWDKISDSKNK